MTTAGGHEPSFDPRTWRRQQPQEGLPASPPPAPPARPPVGKGPLLAAVGVVAVLAAGGAWLALRKPEPAPAPPAAKAAAPVAAQGLERTLVLGAADDLAATLSTAGLQPDMADRFAQAARAGLGPSAGELRVSLFVPATGAAQDVRLEVRRADGTGVRVVRAADGGLVAEPLRTDLETRIKVVRGEMDAESFYSSAVAAGITDSLIGPFAEAFAFDFDFQREIRPGDIFEAAFEVAVDEDGEAAGGERLVYASLQTAAKSRALYRFQPPGEKVASWFDGNGRSVARSLMRTPVEGARISSIFGPRKHPVLGYTRVHKGTDFAIPIGTAVFASGDGVVDFVGPHGGHGQYVRIRHNATLQTAYAHLSVFGPGIAVGAHVVQGQEIARSGNTGLSSGPHLHYEVIVSGAQVDPMGFETQSGRTLQDEALKAFVAERDKIDRLRAAQNG